MRTSVGLRRLRLGADDRTIFALAVPALGALAAEPLYVLVDTAIVGHLGVAPLAALALAATLLSGVVNLCNFLAYGSTPMIGRLYAAGRRDEADALGHQTLILAIGLGLVLGGVVAGLAPALVSAIGGRHRVGHLAAMYMRIAAIGLPCALVAVAGQGYLRGIAQLRLPLVILLAGNALNVVLEVVFVYTFHLGIAGSAWATVIAQVLMAAWFVVAMTAGHHARWRPHIATLRRVLTTGGQIFIRTGSLYTAFLLAGAILARVGAASLAAHQIAFQLWSFLALVLDALAIAAQVLVSHQLGVGEVVRARQLALRTIAWSVVVGGLFAVTLMALTGVLPRAFTDSARVLDRAHAAWPIFALMQPINAVVFALDGVLIGAGDTRYLMWGMVVCSTVGFAPLAIASLAFGWGIVGVWFAILSFVLARLVMCAVRLGGERWAVAGERR